MLPPEFGVVLLSVAEEVNTSMAGGTSMLRPRPVREMVWDRSVLGVYAIPPPPLFPVKLLVLCSRYTVLTPCLLLGVPEATGPSRRVRFSTEGTSLNTGLPRPLLVLSLTRDWSPLLGFLRCLRDIEMDGELFMTKLEIELERNRDFFSFSATRSEPLPSLESTLMWRSLASTTSVSLFTSCESCLWCLLDPVARPTADRKMPARVFLTFWLGVLLWESYEVLPVGVCL